MPEPHTHLELMRKAREQTYDSLVAANAHLAERVASLESRLALYEDLPAHKCGLYLSHNEHRDYYETAEQWVSSEMGRFDWENEEAKQRAIDTDECWTLQWYPETPVGFNAIAAPTLSELLRWVAELEARKAL